MAAREVRTAEELAAAADELRPPYVLKALGLLHKSDAGGVVVGIASRAALLDAHARLVAKLDPPSFSVEEMADLKDGVELIVGARWDPRFGPTVLVGMGGTATEVLRDVQVALAPVDENEAARMLGRLRTAPLLGEHRGRPAVDLAAAARAVARLSEYAAAHPEIAELEINPLLVTPSGATALDARIVTNQLGDTDGLRIHPRPAGAEGTRRGIRRTADGLRGRGRAGRRPAAQGNRRQAHPGRDGRRYVRHQHARRVGRRRSQPARAGDRRGGVRQGHQLPVGHPVAAGERACLASPEQRERYLLPILRGERFDAFATTEPDAGSDAGAIATTATPVDGGWLINGEKWFVTCGDVADFLLVQANVLPGNENTLFFVEKDTPGVRISRTPHFMHSAVNGHPEFIFENVFVPTDAVLGEVGQGFELTKDWFTDERLMIAARTVGVAERALRLARDWAIQRKQFGVPISDFQMIQSMLADCAVDIAVNRSFTHQVAWEADNGADRKTVHAKASIAKLSASEAAGRVVDRCLQIFGGRGYDRAYPIERMYREVRVDRIWEGTSEIQRVIIANELIKRGTAFLDLPVA